MTGAFRVPGVEKTLCGRTFILPPLNAAGMKQYRDRIRAVPLGHLPDIELVVEVAHCSLLRNYPDLTFEEVEEVVDTGNYFDLWQTLMSVSGLVEQMGGFARRVQEMAMLMNSTT